MNTLTITNKDGSAYDIVLTDSFESLADAIRKTGLTPDRIAVIADSNTAPLYSASILECLRTFDPEPLLITIPAGEIHKNLTSITSIYDALIPAGFTRKSLLISLGGGVIGDMTGFASATYMRGIPFIQIPTTLLSQVDASIGGKTGFDYNDYKNMIGAFHMPSLVYINMAVIGTLPEREFRSGMAEVVKSALIKDEALYNWLKENVAAINAHDTATLEEMVRRTCMIKQGVVTRDPFENGERMLLNLGHTIGHAVEKALNFTMTHGECVALGMVAASRMSADRSLISEKDHEDIVKTLKALALPVSCEAINRQAVLNNTKSDKKMQNKQIRFVLLRALGDAFTAYDVTDEEMMNGIAAICPEV
ncbi:MAG: 3-dehydroquinate synthase [Lachnospiraceae bacterium]|nr:3-dehydroquinate synthase [Lachnospiraceae bacterium]